MVRFGNISGSFSLTMGILARLRLAKIRTMARPNSPDMPPKRTTKVRLGINIRSVNKASDWLIHNLGTVNAQIMAGDSQSHSRILL